MSKSETKEPNHFSPSHANLGIMRFHQAHSVLVAAFVTDMDTMNRRYSNRTVVAVSMRRP